MIFYHDAGKSHAVTKRIIYWQHQKRSDRSAKGQNRGILANVKGTLGIIFPSEKEKKKRKPTTFEVTLCHQLMIVFLSEPSSNKTWLLT